MAANSLYPSFVKIDYHSVYSVHSMTIPTLQWDDETSVGGKGQFMSHAGTPTDADAMIKDLIDLIKVFFLATTSFDAYTIYVMDTPTSVPLPVAANSLGVAGTSVETEWAKAVQTTFTIRTALFGVMKLVLLDAPAAAGFDRIASFDASPEAEAIVDELSDVTNGWAGRDGGRPNTLVQIAYTLNEKLRREYHMN
jgi:hypothetical protein